jgi:hypothetical protein
MGRVTQRGEVIRIRDGALSWPSRSWASAGKAVMACIPVRAAVSALSSPAANVVAEAGLAGPGFPRGHSMNVHAGEDRPSPVAIAAAGADGPARCTTAGPRPAGSAPCALGVPPHSCAVSTSPAASADTRWSGGRR